MKYFVLVWAGLWRKRTRTILTFLSIVAAFMLYGTLSGVTASIDDALAGMSETRLRVQNRANVIDSLPIGYLAQIESVPSVADVGYYQTLVAYYREPGNGVAAGAIDLERWLAVLPEIALPDTARDAMLALRTGAVIGRDLAEARGWRIGDRISLGSQVFSTRDGSNEWTFDIVGIYDFVDNYENVPANELWFNYDYFDEERTAGNGRVITYFVTVDDPARTADVAAAIDGRFINSPFPTQSLNERDFVRARLAQIGDIDFFIAAIIGAVFFTLLFLTGNTMMQSLRERIPELAVLKTFGFGDRAVMGLVLAESLILCVAAAGIGLGIASLVFPSVFLAIGAGRSSLEPIVFVTGLGFAVALAAVSALVPALRARRLTIVAALAAG